MESWCVLTQQHYERGTATKDVCDMSAKSTKDVPAVDVDDDEKYLEHGVPKDPETLRAKWEARELCIDCLFQMSEQPQTVQYACWDFDDMFKEPELEANGQFKHWLKRLGKMPLKQRKTVFGFIKARLGLELPAGVLADEV